MITSFSKRGSVYISTAFLCLVACLVGYLLLSRSTRQASLFVSELRQARTAYAARQYDTAVTIGQKALMIAPSALDVNDVRLVIANALLSEGTEVSDISQAANLYKTILASSTKARALTRANAYNSLASLYIFTLSREDSENLARQYVFNSEPYTAILNAVGGDVSKATLELFQRSISTYATPYAYYESAYLKVRSIHAQGFDVHNTQQQQLAASAQQDLAQGDGLMETLASSTVFVHPESFWMAKAISLDTVSYFSPEITPAEIDSAYDKALQLLSNEAQASSSPAVAQRILLFRLTYAASLSARESGQESKIQQLLSGFTFNPGKYPDLDKRVLALQSFSANDPARDQIPALAKISPNFKKYIIQLGWKL